MGIISKTVLKNAAPLTMESIVSLFVNVPMFFVIMLLDVLRMLINHKVFQFKCGLFFYQITGFFLHYTKTDYEIMLIYLVRKGGHIVIKTNKQQYVQTRKKFKFSTLAEEMLIYSIIYIVVYS